jgi:GNAT superfamily N-acetyltransferase
MSNFAIVDLVIPDSVDSENATDFLEMVEIRNAVALEQQGPDGVVSAEELLPRTKRTSDGERSWALVKIDGHVVGRAFCVTAFDSAAPEIEVTIEVLAAFRRRGIGTALLEWARETARSRGKTVLQAQVYMFPREGAPTISPSSGFGAIPADEPGSAFALRHGATLAQVQRGSALILPAPEVVLEPLYADAVKAAGNDYSLVLWTDRTPEQREVDSAALRTRMSTDAPQGDRTATEDVWDAERMRVSDSGWLDSGWHIFTGAAIYNETGRLVAFTEIVTMSDESGLAYQIETLVLREHRGHRLGTLLKIANLRAVQVARPSIRKIVTNNAEENRPMLRVNEAMGFQAEDLAAAWKLAL